MLVLGQNLSSQTSNQVLKPDLSLGFRSVLIPTQTIKFGDIQMHVLCTDNDQAEPGKWWNGVLAEMAGCIIGCITFSERPIEFPVISRATLCHPK